MYDNGCRKMIPECVRMVEMEELLAYYRWKEVRVWKPETKGMCVQGKSSKYVEHYIMYTHGSISRPHKCCEKISRIDGVKLWLLA